MSSRQPAATNCAGWYVLAAVPALAYYIFLLRTAANTPYMDDFYDIFIPLFLYYDSNTLAEGLKGLLWQYHQHFVVYDRFIYWLSSLFTHVIHFDSLIAIGNASLLVFFLQISRSLKPDQLYILPCASAMLFSLHFHENQFWAMGSVQQLTIMAFTLAALQLLDAGRSIISACFLCWLAIFTQSNETLIIPLGLLLLVDNAWRKHGTRHFSALLADRHLIIWLASSITCLAIFYSFENINHVNRLFVLHSSYHSATPLTDIIVNFLSSLASLPFREGSNPWHAVAPGILHLLAIVFFIKRGWQHNRALSLMLLFCTASLLSASILRSPHLGPTAYISRYKIFSTSILCIELVLLSQIYPLRKYFLLLASIAFLSCGYSYYLYATEVKDYNVFRQQKIMEWFYSGNITTFVLADAILDEAYRKGLYNPARDLADYPALAQTIEPTSNCPVANGIANNRQLQVVSSPYSHAIGLRSRDSSVFNNQGDIVFWLCGERSYRVTLPSPATLGTKGWQDLAIVEKNRVAAGNYQLVMQAGDQLLAGTADVDSRYSANAIPAECAKQAEKLQEYLPLLHNRYCKPRSNL